jgi:predicted  nucleic acid-binding Zn-ribbon protein
MPMPTTEPIADLRQQLEQLNQLEDDRTQARRTGRSALNSEALMESLRANMPLGVLSHHDRLRSRGRQSLAEIRHGVCSGCHMTLPTGLQAEVQRQTSLLRCATCGRFIFPSGEADEPAPPAKALRPSQTGAAAGARSRRTSSHPA